MAPEASVRVMAATTLNTSTPLATVLDRLTELGKAPKQRGSNWDARCPAHEDSAPSLRVSQGNDGRAIVHCHAGCKSGDVVQALGLEWGDLFPPRPTTGSTGNGNGSKPQRDPKERPLLEKTYDYTDADGHVVMQAMRLRYTTGEKTFRQRRPDPDRPGEWIMNVEGVEPVLYHLPQLLDSLAQERRIYIVEGEKDVETLEAIGLTATTNVGGALKWKDSYAALFAGADVVVLPDNDEPGKAHAQMVAGSLAAAGATVRVVELPGLPEKGDVSDWLSVETNDHDRFAELVNVARIWSPDPSTKTRWRLDELLMNDDVMRPPPAVVPRLAWGARSTLFAAREKAGKSTLLGYIASQVTLGGSFLNEPCTPGPVLIVGLEEFIGDLARRLRHFSADAKQLFIVDKLPTDPGKRLADLKGHIEAVTPVLVIVDTFIAYGRSSITDLNAAAQVGPVVQEITDLAHQMGPAVILAHHAKKDADGGYRDSSAIGGAVDVIAVMTTPEQRTDPTLRHVRVVGRVPTRHFAFRHDGNHYTLDELSSLESSQHEPRTTSRRTDLSLEDRILAAVRSRPGTSIRDVLDIVGGRRGDALNALQAMRASGALHDRGTTSQGAKLYVPA